MTEHEVRARRPTVVRSTVLLGLTHGLLRPGELGGSDDLHRLHRGQKDIAQRVPEAPAPRGLSPTHLGDLLDVPDRLQPGKEVSTGRKMTASTRHDYSSSR
jgi:hypothetical protein